MKYWGHPQELFKTCNETSNPNTSNIIVKDIQSKHWGHPIYRNHLGHSNDCCGHPLETQQDISVHLQETLRTSNMEYREPVGQSNGMMRTHREQILKKIHYTLYLKGILKSREQLPENSSQMPNQPRTVSIISLKIGWGILKNMHFWNMIIFTHLNVSYIYEQISVWLIGNVDAVYLSD